MLLVSNACTPLDAGVTGLYEIEIAGEGTARRRVYRRWVAERQLWMTTDGSLSPSDAAAQGWRLITE